MRILLFGGGLGNQIFEYAFYLYLKEKFPNSKIYGVYHKLWLKEHNGLEINKYFDVNLPSESFKTNLLSAILFLYKKIYPKSKLLDLNQRKCVNQNAIFFNAFKFDKNYLPNNNNWLLFRELNLDGKNKDILKHIQESNSFFIHVRRGDYLSPKYKERFNGTCSLNYYNESIKLLMNKEKCPVFYCFSDDMEWVMENFNLNNAIYINWNLGVNSVIDMYLMSQCKGGIIANSTFSYWGASLGIEKRTVIYPLKWINEPERNPDIFPKDWIGL
ncbi:alpha-1,2-fucosyltransferase [Bacteroidia bacterium]|nr:alpha-1,2-fucosyltransferase [Bacteroidia bacterium]GHT48399.1 alpha-1,2-fucosyltransferase [Bacteroidia bacterium]